MATDTAMLQGTLDLLILQTLAPSPQHGWGITDHIRRGSGEVMRVNQGSLYVALDRLQRRGWIVSDWRVTPNGRRARYYSLTTEGRRQLAAERRKWERTVAAMTLLLNPVPPRP